jgi:hypothetical protein
MKIDRNFALVDIENRNKKTLSQTQSEETRNRKLILLPCVELLLSPISFKFSGGFFVTQHNCLKLRVCLFSSLLKPVTIESLLTVSLVRSQ